MGLFTRRSTTLTAAPRSLVASVGANPTPTGSGLTTARSFNALRPITAAARAIDVRDKNEVDRYKELRAGDDWQTQCWDYYDAIGEIKYAGGLVGAVTSRVRLYAAGVTSDDTIPSPLKELDNLPDGLSDAAHKAMRMLATANGGIPGLLHDLAVNMFVAGEAYLVQVPARLGSGLPESWRIMSVDQLVPVDSKTGLWGIKSTRGTGKNRVEELPRDAYMSRIWRMHPRYSDEADSSLRALLDLFDELMLLNRTARATARSRLNAGLLYIPDGISISGASDGDVSVAEDGTLEVAPLADDEGDDVAEQLMDSMTIPIQDEASAAAVVPLVLRGPDDLGEKIKLIKFERAFDPQLTQRADKVMDRILAGLDLPKDIVTGLAGVKYSNAVQIEESLYKSHIEPLALLLCDALTVGFLHPVLRSMGFSDLDIANIVIWYDPSAVTTKPGRAEAANTGYANRVISADAWRRANGFAETDAPDPVETGQRIAVERGPLSEPVAEALLKLLIPNLMEQARQDAIAQSGAPIPDAVESVLDGGDVPPAANTTAPATTSADPLAESPPPSATPPPPAAGGSAPSGLIEP